MSAFLFVLVGSITLKWSDAYKAETIEGLYRILIEPGKHVEVLTNTGTSTIFALTVLPSVLALGPQA